MENPLDSGNGRNRGQGEHRNGPGFDHQSIVHVEHVDEPAMMKRLCASMFLVLAIACGGKGTATSPSPVARTTTTFALSGKVIAHITQLGIPGATVSIVDGPDAGRSAITDASGNYTFTELQKQSRVMVTASAINYFSTLAPVFPTSSQTPISLTIFLIETGPSIVLTGQVTDVTTSAPIPGATVRINGRYSTATDSSGNYSLTGFLDIGASSFSYVFAEGYEGDARYIRGTSQNVRLHRIERVTPGDSKTVTVTPDDSLCYNNLQDPSFSLPGSGYLCRTVRVVATGDGIMTLEAVSKQDGSHPPVEAETVGLSRCCSERMGNPTSIQVTAGTEVIVNVELAEGSTVSQSFALTTSMRSQ
jgi:hypothetical protein